MPTHRFIRWITALLLPLSGIAVADDTPVLQSSTVLAPPAKNDQNPPVFIRANDMNGTQNQKINAIGDVELRRSGSVVTADELHYNVATDTVKANGNVCLKQEGLTLNGPKIDLKMNTQIGYMDQPIFSLIGVAAPAQNSHVVVNSRGEAALVNFEGQNHYRLTKTTYTTCPVGDNDWYLRINDLEIDNVHQIGTAHGAEIEFKNTPILYTPWINFPLNDQRKSGFLAPIEGTTGTSGAELSIPWYWNIAPNYDATITPTVISKRGLQMGGEVRYLTDTSHGTVDGNFLQDHLTNTDRWDIFAQHDQTFAPGLSGHFVYQAVSDNNYFQDLTNQLSTTSLTDLDQEATLSYQGSWWQASATVQQYQVLQDPLAPVIPPYSRLPDLHWSGALSNDYGLNFNFTSDLTRFAHPTLVNGTRFIAYPSVNLPLSNEYGYITPKVGFNFTDYLLSPTATTPALNPTRALPIVSVDSGMYFDRNITVFGRKYQQTLEPRLYYVYIPYQDQSLLPNFDSAEMDQINYATLFTENRYIGGDRINNANQLTVGMSTRFLDAESGLERLRFAVGQRLYFTPQLVTLPGETPTSNQSSDVLADVGGQMTEKWRADAAIQYNTLLNQAVSDSFTVNYQPAAGKVINFSYRSISGNNNPAAQFLVPGQPLYLQPFFNGDINQIDLSAQWPIAQRLYGMMRYNYSLLNKSIVEGLAGLEYNGGCWALRGVFQTIAIAANTTNTSFFFQLELNGLGSLGSNPLDVLKLSVPGYTDTNELNVP
ncbi:MAG: LPS-assembly protein LptD [Sulfuriferula sp.]